MRGPRSGIRQYAGVLFLVIIRFSLAEKSCGVFAREKWRQRKRGAVGRLAPVNATRNVGRYLYPQKPYVLLLSEGTITQNSAKDIIFDCDSGFVDVYVSNENYSVDFLDDKKKPDKYGATYIGTLNL